MDLYKSESIPIPELNYNDNQDVLDLIMKKPIGIIPVLDEEGMVPRGTWEGFLSKITKHHPNNKRYKFKHITREFAVIHYAGEVVYDPKLFLAKNKDTLSQEIIDELSLSRHELISYIFKLNDSFAPVNADSPVPAESKRLGGVGEFVYIFYMMSISNNMIALCNVRRK